MTLHVTQCWLWRWLLFSLKVVSNPLQHHGMQHGSLPCPSVSPGVCSDSCPLRWRSYLTISSSEVAILWPPDAKRQLLGKDPDAGKDWEQEEKGMTEDEAKYVSTAVHIPALKISMHLSAVWPVFLILVGLCAQHRLEAPVLASYH